MHTDIKNSLDAIYLEPISNKHLEATFQWISDPEFRKGFMMRGDINWKNHVEYFDNLQKDSTQQAFAILSGERHLGNCGLKFINFYQRNAELWIYVGSKKARGIGLGANALNKLLEIAKKDLGLEEVCVHVAENNKLAINLYKSSGFIEKGDCSEEWKGRNIKMLRMLWKSK